MTDKTGDLALRDLQDLFLNTLFDASALPAALKAFSEFCGGAITQLMVAEDQATLLQSAFSEALDPDLVAREADYQQISPRVLATPRMTPGKATRDKDFITPEAIRRDRTYQELILPLGLGHFSGVPVINSPRLVAGLALHRSWEKSAFSDEEVRRQEAAVSACAGAFHLASAMHKREVRHIMELFGPRQAVAILNKSGRIIDYNEPFETHCLRKGLSIKRGTELEPSVPSARKAWHRAIQRQNGTCLIDHNPDGGGNLYCSVMPVPQFGFSRFSSAHVTAVFHTELRSHQIDQNAVQNDFGLTPAESETLALLADGLTTEEMSVRRSVEQSTTITLIKRLMVKMNCRSRAQLVRLIASYRLL